MEGPTQIWSARDQIIELYLNDVGYSTEPDHAQFYLNWLENDVTGWLNDEVAFMHGPQDGFIKFMKRIPDVTVPEIIACVRPSTEIVPKILDAMTTDELFEFLVHRRNEVAKNSCIIPSSEPTQLIFN
jgi:hypothetical protein